MATDIGKKIRKLREEKGMTQQELANKVGYKSRVSINKIELQRDLPINKLIPIAKALDVDIKYLTGWTDDIEKQATMDADILCDTYFSDVIEAYLSLSDEDKKEVCNFIKYKAKC